MTTKIDRTSTPITERSDHERDAGPRWRRPLLVAVAAAAVVACVVAIRAGAGADTPTRMPAARAERIVSAQPTAPVELDWCIAHRPC